MATSEETPISAITVKDLLGRPLNDVEEKFAPETLYVKGTIPIPLQKPRVSIVGSRKASPNALEELS
jgi:DNA processing protein